MHFSDRLKNFGNKSVLARWLRGGCCLLMLAALPALQALAQESEREAAAVADLDPAAEAEDQGQALALSRELSARQAAIEALQSDVGIYAPELIEAYDDLARFYVEQKDHENAARLHNDALQIARINTGLYSESQLGIIDALITDHRALEDWREVDDLHQLSYLIQSRLFSAGDPQRLAAATSFGAWKLELVRENPLELSSWNLINEAEDLSEFYERTIVNAEAGEGMQNAALLPVLFGKTEIDMALARSIASTPYTAFQGTVSQYITQTRCRNVTNAAGQVMRQCYQVQVENPRYRQSQRDAKQFAINRQTREISRSIERLLAIRDEPNSLDNQERVTLETQIAQLQVESEQLLRAARRRSLF